MTHLDAFRPRTVLTLDPVARNGWHLKRYAILADGRDYADDIATAAADAALARLPDAGALENPDGNHGVGFQIIHFAQVAVVVPTFYWQWGSVLAHSDQIRAPWSNPTRFETGKTEVFGCIWEMEIVTFEVQAWTATMLSGQGTPGANSETYLSRVAV